MTIPELATDIYTDLGEPADLSLPQITYWVVNNIGQLNTLLAIDIVYNEDTEEFEPELTIEQANIYKLIYFVRYYSGLIKTSLGAASYDWNLVTEGDTTIRRASKNDLAKSYSNLRDSYRDDLSKLVFFYKQNNSIPAWFSGRGSIRSLEIGEGC